MSNYYLLTLVVVMLLKHSLADYVLQLPFKYMYGKFAKTNWVLPLLTHCAVHAGFTFVIAYVVSYNALIASLCAAMDLCVHFVMDRCKASPDLLGRFDALSKSEFKGLAESLPMCKAGLLYTERPEIVEQSAIEIKRIEKRFKNNMIFWFCLELDQLVHHLTDLATLAILVAYVG